VEAGVEKPQRIHRTVIKMKHCRRLRFQKFTVGILLLHQLRALTIAGRMLPLHASTVERVGENKTLPIRCRLGDQLAEATRPASRPEKTNGSCEGRLGFGTVKAVITSGVVTVHASTLLALSQELAARA